MIYNRIRFHAEEEDFRPVKFPPPGPYWCTGYGPGYSVIVAYWPEGERLADWWPEASHLDTLERNAQITFTDRFPCPDWWRE